MKKEVRKAIKLFLSCIDLIPEHDSRELIVDIFYLVVVSCKKIGSADITARLRKLNISCSPSNVRRQLFRLKNKCVIQKEGSYYLTIDKLAFSIEYNIKIAYINQKEAEIMRAGKLLLLSLK